MHGQDGIFQVRLQGPVSFIRTAPHVLGTPATARPLIFYILCTIAECIINFQSCTLYTVVYINGRSSDRASYLNGTTRDRHPGFRQVPQIQYAPWATYDITIWTFGQRTTTIVWPLGQRTLLQYTPSDNAPDGRKELFDA